MESEAMRAKEPLRSIYTFELRCSWCDREFRSEMAVKDNGETDVITITVHFRCKCGAVMECAVDIEGKGNPTKGSEQP